MKARDVTKAIKNNVAAVIAKGCACGKLLPVNPETAMHSEPSTASGLESFTASRNFGCPSSILSIRNLSSEVLLLVNVSHSL